MNTAKFLTMRLEDGEQVVRLRGGRGTKARHPWRSDRPHAGSWGEKTDYVLVPCRNTQSVKQRAWVAVSSYPGLENRSSDAEVLLLGSPEVIEALVTQGPLWCRALTSRRGQPRSEAQKAAAARLATR